MELLKSKLGPPELTLSSWAGLAAPARTPEPILQQLYLAVHSILKDPATQEAWVKRSAMAPKDLAPAAYRCEIEQRIGFYRDIVRANKIVPD